MELKAKKRKLMSENIIKKIKSLFFRYIKNIIKKNSIDNNINLLIPQYKIVDISSKSNKKLFYMKIKDIYLEATKNNLYSHIDKDYNKKIIKKIYKEGKEIKVIQVLELTFKELFIIFRKKLNNEEDEEEIKKIAKKIEGLDLLDDNNNYPDINNCLDSLRQNNGNNQEETEEYINKIKNLCCNYEFLFGDKNAKKMKKKENK